MNIVIAIVCLGAVLNLALLVAIHRKLDAIPDRAIGCLRREIEAGVPTDVSALEHVTAKRVTEIVRSLEGAAEQMRASAAELRTIQGDGAELLIEQRAYTGELSVLARAAAKHRMSIAPRAPELEDEQRKTVEMARPPASCAPAAAPAVDDDEPEEELTQVAARPVAGTPSASNGLRLPSRAAIPPPPASPRGSEQQ